MATLTRVQSHAQKASFIALFICCVCALSQALHQLQNYRDERDPGPFPGSALIVGEVEVGKWKLCTIPRAEATVLQQLRLISDCLAVTVTSWPLKRATP